MNAILRLLFAALLALAPLQAAIAHGLLERAVPKAGSVLRSAPDKVRLKFNERIEAAFSTIELADAAGQPVAAGKPRLDPADRTVLELDLPPLKAGRYTVAWRIVSADTHTASGKFTFEVKPE